MSAAAGGWKEDEDDVVGNVVDGNARDDDGEVANEVGDAPNGVIVEKLRNEAGMENGPVVDVDCCVSSSPVAAAGLCIHVCCPTLALDIAIISFSLRRFIISEPDRPPSLSSHGATIVRVASKRLSAAIRSSTARLIDGNE